jgi:hypothetical protein
MENGSYEYLRAIRKAPEIKQIILSQTNEYDDILENTDHIRKFVAENIIPIKPEFIAKQKNFRNDHLAIDNSKDIFDKLTDNNTVTMVLYTRHKTPAHPKYGYSTIYELYIGIQVSDNNVSLRQRLVTANENKNEILYKSVRECSIKTFKGITFKEFFINYPEFIYTVDIKKHCLALISNIY